MNLANQLCQISCRNAFRRFSSVPKPKPFALEHLSGRAIIRLKGDVAKLFLQDLITNDINHLTQRSNSIYAMFLNKGGRVLYDSIVYKTPAEDTFFVECDQQAAEDLKKHLMIFRIRKKIDIAIVDDVKVWAAFNPEADLFKTAKDLGEIILSDAGSSDDVIICHDPRLKNLGTRIIASDITELKTIFPNHEFVINSDNEQRSSKYQKLRFRLGIAEGTLELPTAKCFPLESNVDYLHGVSFHKGCYLGQELTARTYHTGVIRKRLMPMKLIGKLGESSTRNIETTHGYALGKLKAFDEDVGIGLLKVEMAMKETSPFVVGGAESNVLATAEKPFWWSVEAPTLQSIKERCA